MTRTPVWLGLTGTGLLAATAFLAPGALVAAWVPLAVILASAAPAAWGATRARSRWMMAGVLGQLVGIALTGPFMSAWLAWLGTLGVVFIVGAWTLSHAVTQRVERKGLLFLAAGFSALVAATLGWVIAQGLALAAISGADARAFVTAWLVLATALTWGVVRWTRGGVAA